MIRIRNAILSDVPVLDSVEKSAARAFIESPVGYVESRSVDPALLRQLVSSETLWVAADESDTPAGFAACYPLEGFFYLHEISVAREYQGKGVGRRLMYRLEDYAIEHGYPYIGLVTFRDVRWNGPFYKSLGFQEIAPDLYTGLRIKFEEGIRQGLNPQTRCVMIKVLER